MRKLTTEEFIRRVIKVHKNRYGYSKVNYFNSRIKITIICSEHGEFEQTPSSHLNGQGCPSCGGSKKSTTKEFVEKATKVHRDKYIYSKVNYINNQTKVTIICPKHGEFEQTPSNHLSGQGCCDCGIIEGKAKNSLTTKEFVQKANKVHNNVYDYSKVNYINTKTKVTIICLEHGEFEQKPNNHLSGQGCLNCVDRSKCKSTTGEFIQKANEVHSNKYGYLKVEYINNQTKVTIICPEHGEFEQTPTSHLSGKGCPECGIIERKTKNSLTTEKFIQKANEVHDNIYDYSKVEYVNSYTKVTIICPEHGEFEQKPNGHLSGQGCPKCKSSKGEEEVRKWLAENNILFEEQKTFEDCVYKSKLKFDFYISEPNTLIEYDGVFHFKETTLKNNLSESLIKDKIKDEYCINNNINLVRIGFWEKDNVNNILRGLK